MPESFINCPMCGRPVAVSEPPLPFCSERCRLLDLGNWASGRYVIPAPIPEDERVSEDDTAELRTDAGE
ncbi:MAG: DNA gyrase inhibitor YacG [Acidobacteria bacterium]|nr:DNA gyrase inhibitor YacG [Acidobacteriota bacterium]